MNEHDCAGCPLTPRREFLREAALAVSATLLSLGLTTRQARALGVALGSAARAGGSTVAYPLPAADGVTIDKDNEVILVRFQGAVYAFALSCPHQNTALRWNDKEGRFQCPKHKSRYEPTGTFISGRATRGMDRFTITRRGGEVVVDLDALHKQDEDRAGWDAAVVRI